MESNEIEIGLPAMVVSRIKIQAKMKKSALPGLTQKKKVLPKVPDDHGGILPTLSQFINAHSKNDCFNDLSSWLEGPSEYFSLPIIEFSYEKSLFMSQYRTCTYIIESNIAPADTSFNISRDPGERKIYHLL